MIWYDIVRRIVDFPFVMCFGLITDGKENVPDEGPVILACNHQSFLDPMIVGIGVRTRQTHYMARENLLKVPILGPFLKSMKVHPVKRGHVDPRALRKTLEILRAGDVILIFPEGTRTRDGGLGEFKAGVGAIAARTDAWIVPVCLAGTFDCWPRSQPIFRRGRVRLTYGKPFKASPDDKGVGAVKRVREEVGRMLEESNRRR